MSCTVYYEVVLWSCTVELVFHDANQYVWCALYGAIHLAYSVCIVFYTILPKISLSLSKKICVSASN